jgi:hypothetical protein
MEEKRVVALGMGTAFLLVGCLLTVNERLAARCLRHGKARIWVTLLGLERAMKLTRYFFGPLTVILGLIGLALGSFSR